MNILNMIDTYLEDESKNFSRKREHHYASDVNACTRQLYYKWKSEKRSNPVDSSSILKMRMGDKIHDLVYDILKNAGYDIISEVGERQQIDGLKHKISYRLDNIISDSKSGELAIIEVKTSYGAGIKRIQTQGEPRDSDLLQLITYMYLVHINKGYLVYIGRDNSYRTQFEVEIKNDEVYCDGKKSPFSFDTILSKLTAVEYFVESNTLPGRDYKAAIKNGEIRDLFQKDKVKYKTDWQCSYCQWKDHCWREEKEKYKDSDNSQCF